MAFNPDNYKYDNIDDAKKAIKDFVKDIIEFLRTGVYEDVPIEIDPDLPENTSQLLKEAFEELNTDGIVSSVSGEIDHVNENDLEKLVFLGKISSYNYVFIQNCVHG